jgi:hypothetical protein
MSMRQMLGTLILGTVLATGAVAAHANGFVDLGLPPLDPMGAPAVSAQAGEPDVQVFPHPSSEQSDENRENGSNQ